jgi:hypothetical protein
MIKQIWTLEEVKKLIDEITDQQSDPYPHPEEHYWGCPHDYRADYWNEWLERYCNDNVDNHVTLTAAFNSLNKKDNEK